MSNKFSSFIKRKILKTNNNLVSLNNPYEVIGRVLRGQRVTAIIDAGASNGRISERLLREFPDANVYAFEPSPLYVDVLEQYAKEEPRFHPQFLALSDREEITDLHITESPGNTSLFVPAEGFKEIDPDGAGIKSVEKVQAVTIDRWAKRNAIHAVEVMKFDIQAGELKALRGAVETLKTSTLLVYTEIWFNSVYNNGAIYSQIDLFLRELGFVLYDIFKPRYSSNGLITWANAMFVHPEKLGI